MMTFEKWWARESQWDYETLRIDLAKAAWDAATEAAKPRWIPVSERLPDKEQKCVIKTDEYEEFQTAWFNQLSKFEVSHLMLDNDDVTHWMELPE